MKYRWEYCYDGWKRRWRLLTECVGRPIEVRSLREAHDLLTLGHPALDGAREIFMCSRDRVDYVPWAPFVPSTDLLAAHGPHCVETLQRLVRRCNVDGDGWIWSHEFGDSA